MSRLFWFIHAALAFIMTYRPVVMGAGRRDFLEDQDRMLRGLAEGGGGFFYTRAEADVLRRHSEAERLARRAAGGLPPEETWTTAEPS